MRRSSFYWVMLLAFVSTAPGVEWALAWTPSAGEEPQAEVCTFKFGKTWAYAIEIDDGPKWVPTFAVPFFEQYGWTDAPPGVSGGMRQPFVAGVGLIAAAVGQGKNQLSWEEVNGLAAKGWGIINHSFDHRGRSWGDESGRMTDDEIHQDAFWSQALIALNTGGRAPTAVIYANGYADYNRGGALEAFGVGIGTRVSARGHNNVLDLTQSLMDCTRNYLDEKPWSTGGKDPGNPLRGLPALDAAPPPGSLVIDFTHGISREQDSANQQRWRSRLETIERTWGAGGADSLWCAPSGEISDYVRAARAASLEVEPGRLRLAIPDHLPGTPLTVRLTGVPPSTTIPVPPGGIVHRADRSVWITSPVLGTPGAPPPAALRQIHHGPAVSGDFEKPQAIAGLRVRLWHKVEEATTYRVTLRTPEGPVTIAEMPLEAGTYPPTQFHAIMPLQRPIIATGVDIPAIRNVVGLEIWAVDDASTTP